MTRDVVREACSMKQTKDTEMMWSFIEKVPNLRKIELPVPDAPTANIRLTLDYEEDYWMLLTVQRILGPLATRKEIEDLFIRNPDLHRVNWFRNAEWKRNQEEKGRKAAG
jgi:spore coat polysaccharide biosynthesis protein SpsF (cytidylyltransferase family)